MSVFLLLVVPKSSDFVLTVAVFLTVPGVPGAVTVIVNETLVPLFMFAGSQVTFWPTCEQPGDAETNTAPAGSVSVRTTALATPGPMLSIVQL